MKLSNKIIEGVVTEVAGEDVLPLVKVLKNRKNISEFKLAEDISREVNETRNMLYRLYDANLVSFIRKKDKQKGWYIYYWTFNPKRVKYLFKDLKRKRLDSLNSRLIREESNNFFSCQNNCMRLNFEQSIEFNYKCPECGALMYEENNKEKIEGLKREMKQLQKELK